MGGHIEKNELPEEACIREAKEESGVKINLYNPVDNELKTSCELETEKLLVNPMYTILGEISPGHCHIDFVYYAIADSFETNPEDGESKLLKWLSKDDLSNIDNIQDNTLIMANRALDLLGQK